MAISPVVKIIASKIWIWTKVLLRIFFFLTKCSLLNLTGGRARVYSFIEQTH